MATRSSDMTRDDRTVHVAERVSWDETKGSLLTTEFWLLIAAFVGVLYAAWDADNFAADQAWTLITVLAVGYMVSRGLAKSGSRHSDD